MGSSNKAEILRNNFFKTAECIVTHFDDDKCKRDETLGNMENIIGKICGFDDKMKRVTTVLKEMKNSIDDNDNQNQIKESWTSCKQTLLNYEPDVSNLPIFMEYRQQVKEIVNNMDGTEKMPLGDDDIEMTQEQVNIIDAFSKKRMTNPVKNMQCGHVYDRETVIDVLKMNKNTRCPVVGCKNREYIRLEELVTDIKTRKYLHDNPT
ncbi:E3 SUMO-protein ligase NSE2-like [Phymastichus coffea]|uniref:E3 SUMO-protein ligase NSE2-like n=1 Tax=Phymastichus coffea TaxID=108790 RepID=UPI00273B1C49|nr:E3 SUMO-protein ligase NSE2-like [Phymastichus coffea]XP_058806148.1 E3 SUMO-protein ligase NSE2-like [Phymastichus coffea]XP_058806149.1 E3 SUMO-protein ligase NSE2-like [Phymastichus coffea]